MDRDYFYIALYSNASQEIYPDKKISAFTIQLAQPIKFDLSEVWEVGLWELYYPATELALNTGPLEDVEDNSHALVHCDLIVPQCIGASMVRYLRTFDIMPANYAGEFLYENLYYVPVEKRTFRDIRIEILNLSGEQIAFSDSKTALKADLHFRRVVTHDI